MLIHTVGPGQTVFSIAGEYSVPISVVVNANALTPPYALVQGQALVILFPEQLYTVQPGDTVTSVAAAQGTTVNALLRNNPGLKGEAVIFPGQTLVIRYTQQKRGTLSTNGYAYPFINIALLRSILPYLTYVTLFSYGFTQSGELIPIDDDPLINLAYSYGTAPIMAISTITASGSFDSQQAVRLFTSPTLQQQLINNIILNMQQKGYAGVDVDFEFIPAAYKEEYASFMRDLTARANELGLVTVSALAPKTSATQPGLLYEGHDYRALGAAANYVLLMTYEWGYTFGPPLAVAPIENVRQVINYALTEIPPNKIFMGIPNYGYDWPLPFVQGTTQARSIGNEEAVEIARQNRAEIIFDPVAKSPTFDYTRFGVAHKVWFEDARSIDAKLELASSNGLFGVSYWNLMRPFTQNWSLLNDLYDIRRTL